MSHYRGESCGGGLGAVPGGPQKCAVDVSGRRPAILAPSSPATGVLASDANRDDLKLVRTRLPRSWGILVCRPQPRPIEAGHR